MSARSQTVRDQCATLPEPKAFESGAFEGELHQRASLTATVSNNARLDGFSQTPPLASTVETPSMKRAKKPNKPWICEWRTLFSRPTTLEQLRVVKPWHAEAQYSISQPTDINYKKLIDFDEKSRKWIFEDEKVGPAKRCLKLEVWEVRVERDLLGEYSEWIGSMRDLAKSSGDQKREGFFGGLEEVIGEDLEEMQQIYERKQHESLEREERQKLKGNVDFQHGVTNCLCDECTIKRQSLENQHKELERQARNRGETEFERGLPDCPCQCCKESQAFEAEHAELKRKQGELGKIDFKDGVTGCKCVECRSKRYKATQQVQKEKHEEAKHKASSEGQTDFSNGVPGCRFSCQECFRMKLRAQKAQHRNRKREERARGTTDFEKGVPGCACAHCMSKKFGLKTKLVEFTSKETTPNTSCRNSPSPEEREGVDHAQVVASPSLAPGHRGTKRHLTSSEQMEHQPLPKKRILGVSNCMPS